MRASTVRSLRGVLPGDDERRLGGSHKTPETGAGRVDHTGRCGVPLGDYRFLDPVDRRLIRRCLGGDPGRVVVILV